MKTVLKTFLMLTTFICTGACSTCNPAEINNTIKEKRFEFLGFKEATANLPSGKMHYNIGGKGKALLLIHGFGINAREAWRKQVKLFSKHFMVITPDLYWFGDSIPNEPSFGITPQDQAIAIKELLEHLHIKQANIIGASFGGLVSLHLVKNNPELVSNLVLVDSASVQPTEKEMKTVESNFPYADTLGSLLIPKDKNQFRELLSTLFHKPILIPSFILKDVLEKELWKNRNQKLKLAEHVISQGFLTEQELQSITVPTLLIWGDQDPLVLPSIGKRLQKKLPQAKLELIKRAGHMPMLEKSKQFNKISSSFLLAPNL